LKPFLLEEAYEVLEAIDQDDAAEHVSELGDLLFQIVFQAELRAAEGKFGIDDVVRAIHTKMVRRHPHVFPREALPEGVDPNVKGSGDVLANWDKLKAEEHEKQGKKRRALDGVPLDLPALLRAQRIGEKAAAVGFDWPDVAGVRAKIEEELREIDDAVSSGDPAAIEHEVGDLLLAASRLAAKLGVAPEDALRSALRRFQTRFEKVEDRVIAAGGDVKKSSLEELDRLWNEVKKEAGEGSGGVRQATENHALKTVPKK
jgi:tetrapyrrole methylase family protein/MazG family protein/ATP diphosphatase